MRTAAKRYGVSPTCIQKWRGRPTTSVARVGPQEARSTVLTPEEEAIIVALCRHALRPLDDDRRSRAASPSRSFASYPIG
ncbi:MAG TPA: hypothetical protein VNS22_20290, partial [Geminicoccus sp.]|nr:hypothetical protein [Geminicoccus sp.]